MIPRTMTSRMIYQCEEVKSMTYLFIGMMIGVIVGILLGAFSATSYHQSKEIDRLGKELREAKLK